MKRAALFAGILLLAFSCPATAVDKSEKTDKVVWRTWETGLKEAETTKRPVLVDVYTDWCGWCKRMDADVYTRPDVQAYLSRHFVTIKLNAESSKPAPYLGRSHTGRSLASSFGVNGYPTTVFLTSGGDHLVNVPGYVKADRFMLLLRYVGEGHLERGVPFKDFESGVTESPAKGG